MSKKGVRDRTKFLAKLVTENRKPCAFCQLEVDDEITYGKLYSIGDIQCHYFCVLLSCCLIQKGKDEEGLFGFLYPDILAEIERSKKHRCSYCSKDGATLGCAVGQCRKQFHLPCGRERNAISLFYGNYKSFCKQHAPKQKVTDNVMAKAKLRMQASKKNAKPVVNERLEEDEDLKAETVCVICYEEVECFPAPQTFWPPCCARDAWFHRACVQRMSLSAGMHYLKCPLCNDKDNFYQAVIGQGFYVPDRDAAWELEQNAFAEIYERPLRCALTHCLCPSGRDHDSDTGPWDIKLCLLCGSVGAHAQCLLEAGSQTRYVCTTCSPAAPCSDELEQLATSIENVILSEQARAAAASRRPVMPGRMSLRRTKQRLAYKASSTSQLTECSTSTTTSREDLNLKTPRRPSQARSEATKTSRRQSEGRETNKSSRGQSEVNRTDSVLRDIENKLFSPVKLIEQRLREKVKKIGGEENLVLEPSVVEKVRLRFRKPKPLSEKKKIVDGILDDLLSNMMKEGTKVKEPVRTWCSPKKDSQENLSEIQEKDKKPNREIEEIKQEPITEKPSTPPKQTKKEKIKIEFETDIVSLESDCTIDNSESNTEEPIIIEDDKEVKTELLNEDDSSNSTFQLAPEFIAEDSDNSLPIFDTPKKLKTVEIQKDSSMEISENNDVINIDLVKIENSEKNDFLKNLNLKSPVKPEKCAFKFSPTDKESLDTNKMDIDVESFKNQYLNEVDRDFKCSFSHKHDEKPNKTAQLRTAIDFAVEAAIKTENRKRKAKNKKKNAKKRKMSGIVLKYENVDDRKKRKQSETKVSIQNDNMRVKISLKKKKFKLKIMQSKVENTPKNLKQYVLKYSDGISNEVIGKPEKDVTPMKRKYIKQEKSPDNLVQMSIQSFFKGKPSKK